ncbi:HAD-IB family hydrolase [Aquabacterium sp. A7-Y]|uniref:HAD family hydrolase n=1 Tax=Aquabacterium sp. A7-Y TaxID=1349605 RepID=UPI00223D7890|nr:HAD-IB family hydrolase [Aquabacterium sp. A7-Y]MCW7539298.1 HAD-IB family hydrolase [Aquabacterium sp. A7-Y]
MKALPSRAGDAGLRAGQKRYAFFDVDDTLISIKSMFDFFPCWCAERGTPELLRDFEAAFAQARAEGQPREALNRLYYRFFRGALLGDLITAGQDWFRRRFVQHPPPYIERTVARLKGHRDQGVAPVFVSGSMRPLLHPLADQLGVEHCLCTRLVLDGQGRLTGEIASPQTIGRGKADALRAFLQAQQARAGDCYAYGDDISDLAMLEAVGMPVAVGPAADLALLAWQRGWEHLPL